ncbi:hypothetical protein V8E55_005892 [Tylopilus felleus]
MSSSTPHSVSTSFRKVFCIVYITSISILRLRRSLDTWMKLATPGTYGALLIATPTLFALLAHSPHNPQPTSKMRSSLVFASIGISGMVAVPLKRRSLDQHPRRNSVSWPGGCRM